MVFEKQRPGRGESSKLGDLETPMTVTEGGEVGRSPRGKPAAQSL